jgi:hypothetical protein
MVDLIYIAGHARSGSTILELILANSADSVWPAGELSHFPAIVLKGETCTSGHSLEACPVWAGPVRAFTKAEIRHFADLRSSVESSMFRVTPIESPDLHAYQMYTARLFYALSTSTKAATIIDSSKSQHFSRRRAAIIAQIPDLQVTVLHTVRGLGATVASAFRSPGAIGSPQRIPAIRAAITVPTYAVSNRAASAARRFPSPARYVRLDYDNLLSADPTTIEILSQLVERDPDHIKTTLGQSFTPPCGIGGNRMRRKPTVKFRFKRQTGASNRT